MQSGNPPAGPVETIPDFRISLDGSTWPPASGELPAGTGSVTDFSIQRDLTGGGLPGVARGGSGFSVASGSVTLPMDRAELTPWAAAGKRVAPGGLAWLRAHPDTLTSITLGRFIVDECSGASMGSLSLGLVESQRQLDGPATFEWSYQAQEGSWDASLVLDSMARLGGFTTSVWDISNVERVAYAGLTAATYLREETSAFEALVSFSGGFTPLCGQSALAPGSKMVRTSMSTDADAGAAVSQTGTPYLYLTCSGPCVVSLTNPQTTYPYHSVRYKITDTSVEVRLSNQSTGAVVETLTAALPVTGLPQRHLRIRISAGTPLIVTDFAPSVPLSTNGTTAGANRLINATVLTVDTTAAGTGSGAPGAIRDLVVAPSGFNAPAFRKATAYIEPTGSPLKGVFDVAGKSAREVFQAVAAATMGAGWQSETGDLIYRNAASLRTGVPVESVAAAEKLEDLPWSISRDNTADRITVSYTPADVQTDTGHRITLWEATEPIQVGAGKTVRMTVDITGTTDRISPFQIVTTNQADAANLAYSRWHASSSREGGGTRPADDAIRIETAIVSPSQVRLTITNTTNAALWLVDGTGNPHVVLRTSLQVQPGEVEQLAWGQPEDKAVTPFDFDCGQWVQDATVAQQMLAWLVDQMRSPLPTITQVRIIPDLRRQLGDIVRLTDTESGLKAKALITGVSLDGGDGSYTQRLTLAILSVTYDDALRWMKAQGINTYDKLKAYFTTNGLTTYDKVKEHWSRVLVDA